MDLNKAMVIGRLTRDPETRQTPNGAQVTSFSVATNTSWKDGQGQRQDKVEYHNVVAWQKLAEICDKYLKKGSKVYIEGRLETRQWEAQDGGKRNRTEIVARDMIMLDSKGGSSDGSFGNNNESASKSNESPSEAPKQESPAAEAEEETIKLEDIPF